MRRATTVYRITYPNGKIYIGVDFTNNTLYVGSPSRPDLIAADFTPEDLRDFSVRKEILWESSTATRAEAYAKEAAFIRSTGANDPERGYNRRPMFVR